MKDLDLAIELLKKGDVVAAPTETVYGLFADSTNDLAIQKVYRVKGRPSCNPLISHVSSVDMAKCIADFSDKALEIAKYFWEINKAPLTLVLKNKSEKISKFVTAGLDTIAIRCPSHPISFELIERFGGPLAAPSANTSTSVSPTSFEMVQKDIGTKIPLTLDGGCCNIGIESTILDLTKDPSYVILRPGGVSKETIESFLGKKVLTASEANITGISAPGMMKKHYSPSIPVRLNAAFPIDNEAFIAFGKTDVSCDFNLSHNGDLNEAAKNLFSALKKFDIPEKYSGIAIMPIPNFEIGVGINDRLTRAAAKN